MLQRSLALSAAIALALVGSLSARAQVRQDEPCLAGVHRGRRIGSQAGAGSVGGYRGPLARHLRRNDHRRRPLPAVATSQPGCRPRTLLDFDDATRRAATRCHSGTRRISADGPIVSGRRDASPTDHLSRTADTAAIRRRPARLAKVDVGASRPPHADYASFNAELYSRIDQNFRAFFPLRVKSTIRLDEIDWGGVTVNGIPPLRSPKTIPAADATWLRDGHIVFGITSTGRPAYPNASSRGTRWRSTASGAST